VLLSADAFEDQMFFLASRGYGMRPGKAGQMAEAGN